MWNVKPIADHSIQIVLRLLAHPGWLLSFLKLRHSSTACSVTSVSSTVSMHLDSTLNAMVAQLIAVYALTSKESLER